MPPVGFVTAPVWGSAGQGGVTPDLRVPEFRVTILPHTGVSPRMVCEGFPEGFPLRRLGRRPWPLYF